MEITLSFLSSVLDIISSLPFSFITSTFIPGFWILDLNLLFTNNKDIKIIKNAEKEDDSIETDNPEDLKELQELEKLEKMDEKNKK